VSSLSVLSLSRERASATFGSTEPLAVFSNFVQEVVCCMKMCYFDPDGGFDGILTILDEIRFPQPAF